MKKLLKRFTIEFLEEPSLHDVYDPISEDLIVEAGGYITEDVAQLIEDSPIEAVEITFGVDL